ncbi:MAG TPA: ABC transporter substrate-binding protein [Xanthobacteraceae bacterium]|nr:ABC transporter substrate-binding protein [Xanthobacteraceae bacterium]
MDRRKFLQSTATLGATVGLTLAAPPFIARAATKELLVAEPVHSTGYLPMYIAMAKNYFAESDIAVKIVTIETGSGHTNAVLSGQAFAFIGGPEHNAFAKAKGAELRAVVHCVDRGNVYLCAAKGQDPKDRDWPAYMKGKTIAVGPYGGTPNSIMRYLLGKWKLDPKRDVTLIEVPNSAVPAAVRGGQAVIGNSTEPMVTQGIRNGFWSEPFFNVPKELGPYAYSTINVRLDSIQKEPEVVRGFVKGMVKGLKFLYANPNESAEIAKKQFPTMPLEDLKATLDRSFRDEMWSKDGMISKEAWATGSSVVREAGILKTDVKYEEIIDMSFVESVRANL